MPIGANFDPKYKMRYRPDPVGQLRKYSHLPPPLTDDPPRDWQTWEERCQAVYAWMLARKHEVSLQVPERERRGLWFHAV